MLIFPGDIKPSPLTFHRLPHQILEWRCSLSSDIAIPTEKAASSTFHELHGVHPLYIRKMQKPIHSSRNNIHTYIQGVPTGSITVGMSYNWHYTMA